MTSLAIRSSVARSGTEDLDRVGAGLYARHRLVDVVLDILRVAETHAGKLARELASICSTSSGLVSPRGHCVVRLQVDREFDVEKAGGLGAVVGASELGNDRGDLGKTTGTSARIWLTSLAP